ncbi:MAG: DUF5676 family membrane protein [Candidatus Saccharibacteria bacterium]
MKLTNINLANAIAVTTAVLWVVCSAFVAAFPVFSASVTKWWLHGMQLSAGGSFHLDVANFIGGGTTLIFSAWVAGYILGWSLALFTPQPQV